MKFTISAVLILFGTLSTLCLADEQLGYWYLGATCPPSDAHRFDGPLTLYHQNVIGFDNYLPRAVWPLHDSTIWEDKDCQVSPKSAPKHQCTAYNNHRPVRCVTLSSLK